jgi:hypothetical protein
MRREECVRELDFVAFRDVWTPKGRVAPDTIDLRAFRALPIVLLEHSWQKEVGRVTALRLEVIDGVKSLTGTMRVLAQGRNAELDGLAAPLLAGRAGISIAVQWKERAGGPSWLEEISLTSDPAMPAAIIRALNPFEWRIRP